MESQPYEITTFQPPNSMLRDDGLWDQLSEQAFLFSDRRGIEGRAEDRSI
jgi:hypothetical protein